MSERNKKMIEVSIATGFVIGILTAVAAQAMRPDDTGKTITDQASMVCEQATMTGEAGKLQIPANKADLK